MKHLRFLKKRTTWLLVIFGLFYAAIAGRLFYIQVLTSERYIRLAERIRLRRFPAAANRGAVYDRVGRQLAISIPACAVYAQPQKIKDRKSTADRLSELTGVDERIVENALASKSSFVYLGRQLPPDIGERIQRANLPAVGVLRESKRIYPSGSLAAHILGFTDVDGRGLEGIELAADRYLTGKDGCTVAEVDSNGRVIPEARRNSIPPVDGSDVILTIDAYLQHAAEQALSKSFESHSAAGGTAIVLDPKTGEILALANCPSYDPNKRRGASAEAWRNRGVTDLYEPGSTLKLVTVSAGLEEGLSPTAAMAVCRRSGMQIGRRRIRCSLHAPYLAGHGAVNMHSIIANSCNIGAASIALRLGQDKLYSYIKAFGLLDRPGSGLSGEAVFSLDPPRSWPSIRLANIGFGQGIAVSALQMACAYSVIANGGRLMRPQIIREIRTKDGKILRPFRPQVVRRVVSEETARRVTEMLVGCVDEGTGKPSKIKGYTVAGKTGSAQKVRPGGRGYAPGRFVASFMGFLPAWDPRVVICVVVDEPKRTHWGATVAAPVFKEIAQKAMWYLRVPPDDAAPETAPGSGPVRARRLYHDRLGAERMG